MHRVDCRWFETCSDPTRVRGISLITDFLELRAFSYLVLQWSVPAESLVGKQAIVTGANTGLGLETAKQLARAGCDVVLACRNTKRCKIAAEAVRLEARRGNVESMDLVCAL